MFLWVHVENDTYRQDYLSFPRSRHGLTLSDVPKDLHVDHLFNRERARSMGLADIRTSLVAGGINTSHGASYERSSTCGAVGSATRPRGIDEILLLKLWVVASPRQKAPLTPAMQN